MAEPVSKHIFITGASRSGTTMLSRIFNQHQRVYSLNELHVFGDLITPSQLNQPLQDEDKIGLAKKIFQRQQHGIWGANRPINMDSRLWQLVRCAATACTTSAEVYAACVSQFAQNAGKNIACEHTPRNVFYTKALLETYPSAQVVHIIRDPRSVLASQKNKWRRRFLGGDTIPWLEVVRMWCNYHSFTLSKMWNRANDAALKLQSQPRFHIISFESLQDAPQQTIAALCQNMEIEFHPHMLEITHEGSSHQENMTERTGISAATSQGWKQTLSQAEIHTSQKICAKMMKRLAYKNVEIRPYPIMGLLLLWLRFPLHLAGVALFNARRAKIQILSMLGKSSPQD